MVLLAIPSWHEVNLSRPITSSNQEVLRDLTYLHAGRVTYLFHQTDLEKKQRDESHAVTVWAGSKTELTNEGELTTGGHVQFFSRAFELSSII